METGPSIEQIEDSWRYNLDTFAGRVSGGRWLPYKWHVYLAQKLVEAVLRGNGRIIITAPPRHGKSELTSRWLPTWFLDTFPDKRIILASYASTLATDWSEKVRDTFDGTNEHVWAKLNPAHSKRDDWQLAESGGMRSVGVIGGITGFGGDLVLIDDPHKDWAEVQSPTNRAKVVAWFNNTLYHRLEPDATIILIQTRWHEGDLAGYLLDDHEDDWVEIRLPALAEEDDPLGRAEGEALCPERYTVDRLKKIEKAMGPHVFAGLFQQRPAPIEGGMVKLAWLRYYDQKPKSFDEMLQSWDLSFDGGPKSSYVVGQVWGRVGADCYLLDQVRKQMDFPETLVAFRKLSAKWPRARRKIVEKKANGAALISSLRRKISGIVPENPEGSKELRLASVTPIFESGNVHIPNPAHVPWVKEYVYEITTFPGVKADDQVDTTSQALAKLSNSALARLRRLATM